MEGGTDGLHRSQWDSVGHRVRGLMLHILLSLLLDRLLLLPSLLQQELLLLSNLLLLSLLLTDQLSLAKTVRGACDATGSGDLSRYLGLVGGQLGLVLSQAWHSGRILLIDS